jgi:polyisoprenoid-binding protein YceI
MNMKKILLAATVCIAIALSGYTPDYFHSDIYKVNTDKSTLEWSASKMTGKHNGTIKLSSGEIQNDHGQLSGSFEVDMKSITDVDITDKEMKGKLEHHLKSPDFFDVEKHPKSMFVTTAVTPITVAKEGGYTHHIKGNLTIRDKTNEIEFDVIIQMQGKTLLCTGTAVIDRSKFDVKYGSKTFFADIGDKVIYDDFNLQFNIVAAP